MVNRHSEKTILNVYRGIKVKIICGTQDKPFFYRGDIIEETDEFIIIKDDFNNTTISIGKKDVIKIQEDIK